jgi:hypothetical protein
LNKVTVQLFCCDCEVISDSLTSVDLNSIVDRASFDEPGNVKAKLDFDGRTVAVRTAASMRLNFIVQ